MPFPCTKSTVARISQFVADLKSPKRGNSLVVQTGFPASLVDLLVKNRRRLRKSKTKKPETSDPPPPERPAWSDFTAVRAESGPELVGVLVSGPEYGGSGSKSVLAAVLMMFAVVALIAEKLAVAITVSAFALLFLENAGKRVVSFSDRNEGVLNFLTRWIRVRVWLPKLLQLRASNVEGDYVIVSELVAESDEILSFEEVVETKSEVSVGLELDCVSGDKKGGLSETLEDLIKDGKFVGSCKGNRRIKFKSKMKKLLSKKFRKEEKERRGKESEAEAKNHKPLNFEIQEEQKEEGDHGNRAAPLLLKIELECVTENEVDHADTFSQECSLPSEGKRRDGAGNSGLIILLLIALVGLLVGRLAALVLTMTWCFMLKLVATRGRLKVCRCL